VATDGQHGDIVKLQNWRSAAIALAVFGATLSIPAPASAALLGTYTPNPADMNDLDHHMLYTWRIQDTALIGKNITSATLTFTKMFNWDTSGNVLYLWLLNNAILPGTYSAGIDGAGTSSKVVNGFGNTNACTTIIGTTGCVSQFVDDSATTPTLATSVNDFGVTSGGSAYKPAWLVTSADMGTADQLTQRSFAGPGQSPTTSPGPSTTPAGWTSAANGTTTNPANGSTINAYNYTYTFSASDLASLNAFLSDDVFALGLDPDCHFFNEGMTLKLYGDVLTPGTQGAVPEPTTLLLLGTGAALLIRRRLKR
jgi:hypothetical protein